MSVLFTILAVIALVIFAILLSLGLFVALIVMLFIGALVLVVGFFFGETNFEWKSINQNDDHEALVIAEEFNECLLGPDADRCRTKFTHWDEQDKALIEELALQAKRDLGKRKEVRLRKVVTGQTNKEKSITLEVDADFEKKEDVLEYYLLTPDEKDPEESYKIKEMKWTY